METVKSVRQSLLVNDWTVSIDVTDAYLHVPIHPRSRKYLRFMFKDQVFQFTALPFGMSLSPWIFTKLMDIIAAHLCQSAITLFPYLDNWLIRDLICNWLVSHIYRDGISDTTEYSQGISRLSRFSTSDYRTVPFSDSSFSTMGKLSAAADFVLLGRLHLQLLQMCLLSVWRPHILPLDHQVPINRMILFHLKWWMDTNRFVLGMSIHPPNTFLFWDASHYGWGAHLELMRLFFHGCWSEDQSQLHINILEMMVIHLALKKAIKYIHHSCVIISTDNITVVSYINKQGGTHSPNLCIEVWEILHWCLEHDIVIRVCHIPGRFNILADLLSRLDRPLKTEWALDQSVANSIFQMLNYPNVDLFATTFNHKLPLYVSPVPDSHALAIDTLSMNKNCLHAYAISANNSDTPVLAKIRQSRCRIVLIAPLWPQGPWFSEVLQLFVSAPIRLPLFPKLLT